MIKKEPYEIVREIKDIILLRTQVPKGPRTPTRDAVVLLGEELCELIDDYWLKLER